MRVRYEATLHDGTTITSPRFRDPKGFASVLWRQGDYRVGWHRTRSLAEALVQEFGYWWERAYVLETREAP